LLNKTNSETNLTRSRQGLEIAKTAAAAAAAAALGGMYFWYLSTTLFLLQTA
jgi:hypothetical protein